jgi:hypothetical protein
MVDSGGEVFGLPRNGKLVDLASDETFWAKRE